MLLYIKKILQESKSLSGSRTQRYVGHSHFTPSQRKPLLPKADTQTDFTVKSALLMGDWLSKKIITIKFNSL